MFTCTLVIVLIADEMRILSPVLFKLTLISLSLQHQRYPMIDSSQSTLLVNIVLTCKGEDCLLSNRFWKIYMLEHVLCNIYVFMSISAKKQNVAPVTGL